MSSVTVVIPVYNVEKYLEKCVRSVESQTFGDYEIFLVDDGSTDTSGAICDRLAEKNSKIKVFHKENGGQGSARNLGIELCETEYIYFLDSDDFIHPSLLEKCVTAARENQCDAVFFDIIGVNESGEKGALYPWQLPCGQLLSERELGQMAKNVGPCDKLLKTSLFREHAIRFPEKVWYEDLRTIPKLIPYIKTAMRLNSEPLYYYLQREGSTMHNPDRERITKERMEAAEDVVGYYKSHGFFEKYREECDFIWIYHEFLLPCMEMFRLPGNHKKYLDILRARLKKEVDAPLNNRLLETLRRNEMTVLRLAIKRHYLLIRCLTGLNCLIKGKRNA